MELNACMIKGNEKLEVFIMVELWNYNQAQSEVLWFPFRWSVISCLMELLFFPQARVQIFCILYITRNWLIFMFWEVLGTMQMCTKFSLWIREVMYKYFPLIPTLKYTYFYSSKKWDYPFPDIKNQMSNLYLS